MIIKLTKEQEARFQEFVDKWTGIGLSTEPIDMQKVQNALTAAFAKVNQAAPEAVRCTSPLALFLTRAVLDSVRDSVSDSVRASVRASVSDYWYDFGQYAAPWLAFYDYCDAVLGCDTSKLDGLNEICREAGWSLVFVDLALISEKPMAIHRNTRGQLHKDGGLALSHSHVIEDDEAELIQIGERMLLKLTKAATVTHEEHKPITLSPGIWEIGRVTEYDWLSRMERQVID